MEPKELHKKELYEKLDRMFPSYEDKIKAISTSLGSAAIMAMNITRFAKAFKMHLPEEVIMACGITSHNMVVLTSEHLDGVEAVTCEILENLSEQDFEQIYRNMKELINTLSSIIKKEEQTLC